jgi:ABC-type lipoprotein release transport system permease subunit
MEGFTETFERNAVGMNLGDIQIHAKGYRDDPDLYKRIENPEQIIKKLEAIGFSASPRLYGYGLAASGSASSGINLRGMDIEKEPFVTQAHKHMLSGSWLNKEDSHGVVIGRKLARTLGVGVGDEVIIVSQAADGSMANDLYTVRGILKSVGEVIDRAGFFMIDDAFRDVMAMPEGAHEIAVSIRASRVEFKTAVEMVTQVAVGYETLSWRQLQPVVARLIDNAEAGTIIMLLIIYSAIGMVVLNAMLMSVFERIREFGIMKAIGVSPWQIVAIIFAEAVFQAILACALAFIVGLSVSLYFQTHGIDLTSLSGSGGMASVGGVAIDPVWYTNVTFNTVVKPLEFLLLVVVIAVIYPGIKAAVIQPLKAIHHQ